MTRGYDVRDALSAVTQIRKGSTSRASGTGGIVAGCGIAPRRAVRRIRSCGRLTGFAGAGLSERR